MVKLLILDIELPQIVERIAEGRVLRERLPIFVLRLVVFLEGLQGFAPNDEGSHHARDLNPQPEKTL